MYYNDYDQRLMQQWMNYGYRQQAMYTGQENTPGSSESSAEPLNNPALKSFLRAAFNASDIDYYYED